MVQNLPLPPQGYDLEFQRAIERAAQEREVETIKLFKPENSSLGFSVVGLKTDNQGELGIFVQDIQPGGIAARDGRLREKDQILAIDGQPLDISHQEAIRILQSARGLVELIVARGPVQQQVQPVDQQQNQEVSAEQVSNVQSSEGSAADMVLNTEWTQIEVIDLINDGPGLGFGIIGGRSTGVVVKTILPGGVADFDARLRSGDHILQIGDVNVRGMGSDQVATVLRQSGSHVRLIVARPVPEPSPKPMPQAPVVPTHQLDEHLRQINNLLDSSEEINVNYYTEDQIHLPQIMGIEGMVTVHHPPHFDEMNPEYPEVEYFDADLLKDNQGLGITIAGYVGRDNAPDDLCGIFVKSVAEGSAAAQDGRIQVNDQIIEVDGQMLHGFTNHQAVEVLRNTGQMVHLKLARYQHGPKFEKLQQYLAQPNYGMINTPGMGYTSTTEMISSQMYDNINQPVDMEDINFNNDEDYSGELSPDVESAIKACWEPIIGTDFEVVVAQLSKFREGGGLGISLEGTVDVENGIEVRPHHYIRSILHDGPVGTNGRLMSGDELLEVNGKRLLGLNHKEVVSILKELPQYVRLVCARRKQQPSNEIYALQQENQYVTPQLNSGVNEVVPISDRLVKAKSEMALTSVDNTTMQNSLNKMKSRSLEPLTNLAMWSSEPVVIELKKGDKGLGFSILDYQDPVNPSETVIVIRSLVPGGVAQLDGRLVPGDRLIFVNDVNLENAILDEAVQALKGAPKGVVRIGVAKPLPLGNNAFQQSEEMQSATLPITSSGYLESGRLFSNPQPLSQHASPAAQRDESASLQMNDLIDAKQNESSLSSVVSEKLSRSQRDSFYESDEEVTSPVKSKKPVTSPRTNFHVRKSSSQKSYENVEIAQDLKADQEDTLKKVPPVPQPRASLPDYENDIVGITSAILSAEVTETFTDVSPRSPSPGDYENTALPSYEEAMAGDVYQIPPDAEFLNLDDFDAPPVPPRSESQEMMQAEIIEKVESEPLKANLVPSDEPLVKSPKKEKVKSSPKRTQPQRTPPPIPPKPISPRGGIQKKGKPEETPPPLPATSPPPISDVTSPTKDENLAVSPSLGHKMTESVDSSFSSSSEQTITSDLKTTHSPKMSPISSPNLMRTLSGGSDSIPISFEKKIKLKRATEQLGVVVEAVEKGVNGCQIKSISSDGAIAKDGKIKVGDYITTINNESLRRITNAQARAIIRRASLLGTDISITYITGEDAASYKDSVVDKPPQSPPTTPHHDAFTQPKPFTIGQSSKLFRSKQSIIPCFPR
ncbi:hypothetical protein KUTeg_016537 [Tegillarca granosa]|uniref:PDZ domain-containing protein n=1 Tax=Tegillarca granosa TaxID=220873 RepID=A0ABQ9EL58_TEGGR|nr:hypothetical protein KUTeg_016537 [Tegillarca granosa]